jgi:hypothetical protein
MFKTNRTNEITDANVQRFPRLIGGRLAAALSKLFWQQPEVSVRIAEDGRHVEFKYLISIPEQLRSSRVFEMFFGAGKTYLEDSLRTAYQNEKSAKKPIHYCISNFIHRVYKRAFRDYLEKSWKRVNDPETVAIQVREFDQHLGKKSQPDPALAWEIVNRIEQIRPAIVNLRAELANKNNYELMEQHIRPPLSAEVLRRALESILPGEPTPMRVLYLPGTSDDEIAAAYVKCVVQDENPNIKFEEDSNPTVDSSEKRRPTGKPSFKSYIRDGEELERSLSTLPAGDRTLLGINPPLEHS